MDYCSAKMNWKIFIPLLLLHTSHYIVIHAIKDEYGYNNEQTILPCGHNIKVEDMNIIGWTFGEEADLIVTYKPNNDYPLEVKSEKYAGRVSIGYPNGDLTIQQVQWLDAGRYQCVIVTQKANAVDAESYKFTVNVIPQKVDTRCANRSKSYNAPTKLCSKDSSQEGQNLQSISCSVESNPRATIKWIERPSKCNEVEENYCNIREGKPPMCVSQLDSVCEGRYKCEASYVDNKITRKVMGEAVTVRFSHSGHGMGSETKDNGDDDGSSVSMWKLIVGLVTGFILLVVLIVSVFYYRKISKRFKDPNIIKTENEPSCFKVICCPCLVKTKPNGDLTVPVEMDNREDDPTKQDDQVPLHQPAKKENSNRGEMEYHSEEDSPTSNRYNSIQRRGRKQVRPEILQAVQAAKALMSTPEADKVNFMVQTIGGTKYKFEVEKGGNSGSKENLNTAGGGDNEIDDEFLSIKGPTTEKKVPVDVDDVD